jgi:arylsulfatase A-like enzyme
MIVPDYLPDIPEVREDLASMEASIASMDVEFGEVIDALNASSIRDNTLVIFTADHGIAFPQAKMTLYDAGIEVPLIVAGPGVEHSCVRKELVSNVDLVPTLLELLSIPIPENIQGRSFLPLLKGQPYQPREQVFAEKTYHTYYDPMRAVRTEDWKLIANFEHAPWQETSPDYQCNAKSYVEISKALTEPEHDMYHPPFELYNLKDDPFEQRNLADSPDVRATRDKLITALWKWMADTEDPLIDGPMAQGAYLKRMTDFKNIGQPSVAQRRA